MKAFLQRHVQLRLIRIAYPAHPVGHHPPRPLRTSLPASRVVVEPLAISPIRDRDALARTNEISVRHASRYAGRFRKNPMQAPSIDNLFQSPMRTTQETALGTKCNGSRSFPLNFSKDFQRKGS